MAKLAPFAQTMDASGRLLSQNENRMQNVGDCADRIKIITWDGSGLVLVWKRLEHGAFKWPPVIDGVMRLTAAQVAVLFDGMDWSRLHAREEVRPTATS